MALERIECVVILFKLLRRFPFNRVYRILHFVWRLFNGSVLDMRQSQSLARKWTFVRRIKIIPFPLIMSIQFLMKHSSDAMNVLFETESLPKISHQFESFFHVRPIFRTDILNSTSIRFSVLFFFILNDFIFVEQFDDQVVFWIEATEKWNVSEQVI